jgi:hypothetical protein
VTNPVAIASETALIYWDTTTKTEHFFRTAEFDTDLSRVGFIVPTPSAPTLASAPANLFESLEKEIHPVVHETKTGYKFVIWRDALKMTEGAKASAVQIISKQNVAGYRATVVKAADVGTLSKWLANNGFSARPALTQWLDGYVKKGWCFTAFRFDPALDEGTFQSPLIRMSFKSAVPIYPYQEPSDVQPRKGRILRLYFASGSPFEPTAASAAWKSKVEYSSLLSYDFNRTLAGFGPARSRTYGPATWVTSYVDRSTSRSGQPDLTFQASKIPSTVTPLTTVVTNDLRTEIPVTTWFPVGAALLLALSAGIVQFRRMWHVDDSYERDGSATDS